MKRSLQTIGKLFLGLAFAVAISAAPLGCAEATAGDGQDAAKTCPADCSKPCCKSAKACPAGCTKPCCKTAKACPTGCSKPCCKKA